MTDLLLNFLGVLCVFEVLVCEWFERLWVYAELEFRNYSYISFFIFFKYLVVPGREKPQAIFPESRNSGIPCIIPLDSGNRTPVLL